jgi:hypothetical protein
MVVVMPLLLHTDLCFEDWPSSASDCICVCERTEGDCEFGTWESCERCVHNFKCYSSSLVQTRDLLMPRLLGDLTRKLKFTFKFKLSHGSTTNLNLKY